MPRRPKWRCVSFLPPVGFFAPLGFPPMGEVILSVEEVEAIRLKDLEDLEQEECARRMRVSRPTFHRILESGRKKIAEALLYGKAIRIEGGNFELAFRRFRCNRDGHEWEVPFEKLITAPPRFCPNCNGADIQPVPPFDFGWRGGRR